MRHSLRKPRQRQKTWHPFSVSRAYSVPHLAQNAIASNVRVCAYLSIPLRTSSAAHPPGRMPAPSPSFSFENKEKNNPIADSDLVLSGRTLLTTLQNLWLEVQYNTSLCVSTCAGRHRQKGKGEANVTGGSQFGTDPETDPHPQDLNKNFPSSSSWTRRSQPLCRQVGHVPTRWTGSRVLSNRVRQETWDDVHTIGAISKLLGGFASCFGSLWAQNAS